MESTLNRIRKLGRAWSQSIRHLVVREEVGGGGVEKARISHSNNDLSSAFDATTDGLSSM